MIKNKGGEGEGFLELSDKDKFWRENFQVKEKYDRIKIVQKAMDTSGQ